MTMIFAVLAGTAVADEFSGANTLYNAGEFAAAAAAYEKVEPKTANVFFNLGNAWFRQGKLGLALLNYERARALAPRDPDILANVRFAEQRLGVEEVNQSPVTWRRFVRTAVFSRTLREWCGYEVAGVWLTVVFVAGVVWLPRTGFVILAVAAGAGWVVAGAGLAYRLQQDQQAPPAIVTAAKTEARFAPLADATVHFQLSEGTKVAIREDRSEWWFVERADGQQGWVRSAALERVGMR